MTKKNIIVEKSYQFALDIVQFYFEYIKINKEYVLSRQLLRSGTSIGSNVREAVQAQSKKDFISKLSIALKEAHETDYWISLLADSELMTELRAQAFSKALLEIIRILTSILKTSRSTQ